LSDTLPIISALQASEVDMIEVGFPFSDPVADGPTIQASNHVALGNGMTVATLFEQLKVLRGGEITVPVLLMGSLNPIERFGRERFFEKAAQCGVDGMIIPDMPFEEYLARYKPLYERHSIKPVFLITSRTEHSRIRAFDGEKPAFLYVVSSDAVTGGKATVSDERDAFFRKLADMNLSSRLLVGFKRSRNTRRAPSWEARSSERLKRSRKGPRYMRAIASPFKRPSHSLLHR
jgi:tryptophan synthase alpha chain